MAIQLSASTRNARLDAVETAVGVSPILRLRTGAPPANCAAADTGTVLSSIILPSDWMGVASGGSKQKAGTWQDISASAAGSAAHFRIYDAAGASCFIQGTITITGGGGDMTLDNNVIAPGQQVTINTFTLTDGNS